MVLASATATCMLPWKASEGRVAMCGVRGVEIQLADFATVRAARARFELLPVEESSAAARSGTVLF